MVLNVLFIKVKSMVGSLKILKNLSSFRPFLSLFIDFWDLRLETFRGLYCKKICWNCPYVCGLPHFKNQLRLVCAQHNRSEIFLSVKKLIKKKNPYFGTLSLIYMSYKDTSPHLFCCVGVSLPQPETFGTILKLQYINYVNCV